MLPSFPTSRTPARCTAVIFLCLAGPLFAAAPSTQAAPAASLDPAALVRRAVQHRLDSAKNHHPLQYLVHKVDEHHDTTKLIIETKDGDVARLVAINGKPLSADIEHYELARLDNLAQHPELQEHTRKTEQKDEDHITHLLSLLPDAYLYKLEGIVPCSAGQCYRLTFTPNPNFVPPDMESQILRGTAGEVWIDQAQERLNSLSAHFISNVDFGFGIIGKLNKGSTVYLEQNDVGLHDWELTGLKLHVTGKALMVKPLSFQITENATHFSPVAPNLSYRDAIQLLKKYDPSQTPYTP
ncbi:MAG: hypothetical protein ABSG84_05070 [Acidobacteriaceae bacterium]